MFLPWLAPAALVTDGYQMNESIARPVPERIWAFLLLGMLFLVVFAHSFLVTYDDGGRSFFLPCKFLANCIFHLVVYGARRVRSINFDADFRLSSDDISIGSDICL
jgi:hypothetical protein